MIALADKYTLGSIELNNVLHRGAKKVGQAKQKKSRYQRLLEDHPLCCLCGGVTKSSTVDHIPPQACFPRGFFPEGFEFPACEACNGSTKKEDQIFGYYMQMGNPDLFTKDLWSMWKLQDGIKNNYASALLSTKLSTQAKAKALTEMGIQVPADADLTNMPLAGMSDEFFEAATTIGRKMACAIYYKETGGKFLTKEHYIWTATVHSRHPRFAPLTAYLNKMLPDKEVGGRRNIKDYGRRFGYRFGYKEGKSFMVSASQFGVGFVTVCISGLMEKGRERIPTDEIQAIFPTPDERAAAVIKAEGAAAVCSGSHS